MFEQTLKNVVAMLIKDSDITSYQNKIVCSQFKVLAFTNESGIFFFFFFSISKKMGRSGDGKLFIGMAMTPCFYTIAPNSTLCGRS